MACLLALSLSCSGPKRVQVGGSCVHNSDCNESLMCKNGQCHEACKATRDCESPALCVFIEGAAVCQLPEEGFCQAGKCGAPLVCAPDNKCRGTCSTPSDCVAGQTCKGNLCIEIDNSDGAVPQTMDASADVKGRFADGPGRADTKPLPDAEPDATLFVDAAAPASPDVPVSGEGDAPDFHPSASPDAADFHPIDGPDAVDAPGMDLPPAATCGNGKLEPGETCDNAITAGPGACPTSCNDGDSCTTDTLSGSAALCTAICSQQPLTECRGADKCCPRGCNANNDSDCTPVCGNAVVEPGETCDNGIATGFGACLASCDDGDVCTTDTSSGRADQCSITCSHQRITACKSGDGCCASGCNANNDSDCQPVCGNGVVDPNETCDNGIGSGLGACPTSCDDSDACTKDTLSGRAALCTASCSNLRITACLGGDGCCAPGCNANNDSDCLPVCGNAIFEAGETCDSALSSGTGACPTSCNDSDACTIDTLVGSATLCTAICSNRPITSCLGGDGCCAPGCNANSDADCSPVCGNGVVESGETCDKTITAGAGACPAACNDSDVCTIDTLTGSASLCTAECSNQRITTCKDGDGCCASGCNANNDSDCPPGCGNGVVESGETCDKGIASGAGSCPSSCDDGVACTEDSPVGSASNCSASCTHQDITTCKSGDGCCPTGCNRSTDGDCDGCLSNADCSAGTVCSNFLCVACTGTWTATGGGDHCNQDWTPANGTTVGGEHKNVRTFSVNIGVTITVTATNPAGNGLTIDATDVSVAGTIDATAAGGEGGDGGDGAGSGVYFCGANGQAGGAGKGSYPGAAGSAGPGLPTNDSGAAGCCGHWGAAGGAGSRGGYMSVGLNGDSTINMSVVPGSGGGGGGGGGAGSRCGTNNNYPGGTGGGAGGGGRGGGFVSLSARRNVVVAGAIKANGVLGGNGSNGTKATDAATCRYSNPPGGSGGSGTAKASGAAGAGVMADFACINSGGTGGKTNTIGGDGGVGGAGAGGGILLSGTSVDFAAATLTTLGGGGGSVNGGTIKVFYCTVSAGVTSNSGRYYAARASSCP